MIQIGSKLIVVDNSGVKKVQCINIIGKKKVANIGNFLLVTLRSYTKNLKLKKRTLYLGLLINIKYWVLRKSGVYLKFYSNNILIFNIKFKFLGSRIIGILSKEIKIQSIKEKNFKKNFQKIISYSSLIV